MRDILFRGKDIDGKWVEGYYIIDEMDESKAYIGYVFGSDGRQPHDTDIVMVDKSTACQYTGLTDKNGRKIFEGDICEFSVFDYNGHDTQYKGVVVYCGSRFMLWKSKDSEYYGADGGFDLDWTVGQDDEFEVIGNIFDNPELIGDQS